MNSGSSILVASVLDQWERTWAMWEDLVTSIPEEQWCTGENDYLVPARHLIHVVNAEDIFAANAPVSESDECKWFGVAAWETPAAELPDKQAALQKLEIFKEQVRGHLSRLVDADLLELETVHPWTGRTRLGKILFTLRHTEQHLGEVNAEMIRCGLEGVKWR